MLKITEFSKTLSTLVFSSHVFRQTYSDCTPNRDESIILTSHPSTCKMIYNWVLRIISGRYSFLQAENKQTNKKIKAPTSQNSTLRLITGTLLGRECYFHVSLLITLSAELLGNITLAIFYITFYNMAIMYPWEVFKANSVSQPDPLLYREGVSFHRAASQKSR